jgi:hypothetical protein
MRLQYAFHAAGCVLRSVLKLVKVSGLVAGSVFLFRVQQAPFLVQRRCRCVGGAALLLPLQGRFSVLCVCIFASVTRLSYKCSADSGFGICGIYSVARVKGRGGV